jgi:hypothetical protein
MGFSYRPLLKKRGLRDEKNRPFQGGRNKRPYACSRGEYVSGETLEKLCLYFHCQPGDLFEYQFPDLAPDGQGQDIVF